MPPFALKLGQKTALWVLLVLLKSDPKPLNFSMLQVDLGGKTPTTINRSIDRLKDLQLIKEEKGEYHNERLISLTEKGRAVAGKVEEIEGMLGGQKHSEA